MDKHIIIGEIFSFIAAIFLALSTFRKNKEKMMKLQVIDSLFNAFSNLYLNSLSGFVVNILTTIRNIFNIKNKFNCCYLIIYCIIVLIMGTKANNRGIIGVLPIFASIEYSIFLFKSKNSQIIRYSLILNLIMWMIYDYLIKAYPMFFMDFIIIIITLINAYRYKIKERLTIIQ